MPVSIPAEAVFFLYSMLYGAAFFCVYDVLRCIRRVFVHNVFWIAAEDLAFWMAAGILLFLMVFEKNSGIYRSCFFLGISTGLLLWYCLFDRIILKILTWILNLCKRAVRKILYFLGKPASFLGKRCCWTFRFLSRKRKKVRRFFGNHLKKCLRIVKISSKKDGKQRKRKERKAER